METIWRVTGRWWRRLGKYQLAPYPRWLGIVANILQGFFWLINATIEHWHFDGIARPFYEGNIWNA